MVCSLSCSETVHYTHKKDTQEAWIEFGIASISDVLCKRSSFAFSFETHTSKSEKFADEKQCNCKGVQGNYQDSQFSIEIHLQILD
jgi:hypothetical protein